MVLNLEIVECNVVPGTGDMDADRRIADLITTNHAHLSPSSSPVRLSPSIDSCPLVLIMMGPSALSLATAVLSFATFVLSACDPGSGPIGAGGACIPCPAGRWSRDGPCFDHYIDLSPYANIEGFS